MLIGGVYAGSNIRAQFFPDVVLEVITVSVAWSGAGAEDVDTGIVGVGASALLAVEGVESTSSTATEGRGSIRKEFEAGWDMSRATDDVKAVVDNITTLPDNAEDPVIRRAAFRDRVTDVVVYGPTSLDLLSRFADELQLRLTVLESPVAPSPVCLTRYLRYAHPKQTCYVMSRRWPTSPMPSPVRANRIRRATSRKAALARAHRRRKAIRRVSRRRGHTLAAGRDTPVCTRCGERKAQRQRRTHYFVGDEPAVLVRVERSDNGDAIEIQKVVEATVAELQDLAPKDEDAVHAYAGESDQLAPWKCCRTTLYGAWRWS